MSDANDSSDPSSEGPAATAVLPDPKTAALRERAKTHFPSVLLTLTSIIQAIALETLWSSLTDEVDRLGLAHVPLDTWLQASALFIAIVVLWVYYAQLVMRLVWVPGLTDSLVPFLLGIGQFIEAGSLGTADVALWLAPFPFIFLVLFGSWNRTLRRAAEEPENAAVIHSFFPDSALVRLGPVLGSAGVIGVLACVAWRWPGTSTGALVVLNGLLFVQLVLQRRYWQDSVEPPSRRGAR
ncbi:MAG: hypothetical protein H6748_00805 [Spirochaetaceae bacterium]|nr:hypothetical protein [Myxococcales bacterium]MCB9722566.1 hypothetical protein [Spirochaetaceae bacterium]